MVSLFAMYASSGSRSQKMYWSATRVNKKIIKKLERKYQTSMMDDSIKILLPPFNEDENIFLNWKALLPP